MSTENRVNLELDQHRRIGIKDVISCLLYTSDAADE